MGGTDHDPKDDASEEEQREKEEGTLAVHLLAGLELRVSGQSGAAVRTDLGTHLDFLAAKRASGIEDELFSDGRHVLGRLTLQAQRQRLATQGLDHEKSLTASLCSLERVVRPAPTERWSPELKTWTPAGE